MGLTMHRVLAITLVALIAQPIAALAQSGVNQNSMGNCSPNIVGRGDVTVICPDRQGATPEEQAIRRLELQQQMDRIRIEQANRRRAYRQQNGGCDIGTHRVCVHVGPAGGGYNAGCFCQRD